jgi:hypothetical protein
MTHLDSGYVIGWGRHVRVPSASAKVLGDYDQSIDIWEINREKQAAGKAHPPAGRGGTTTQQQTGGRGRGGRGGQ